ncbi:MAG TPA: hypothetical protein VM183_03295 [Burkholderiales bacterium]|nr:hypothetical protein [Burkholderiales bacterium]
MAGWLLILVLFAPLAALSQERPADDGVRAGVGLRRDTRLERLDLHELRNRLLHEVDWKLTLGVAEVHAENGDRLTATPFQVRARFNQGRTAFKLSGDGYDRLRSRGETAAGFADVNAMLTQVVAEDAVLEGGLTLPAGGEVGSSHARERVGAIYHHAFSTRWEGQVHGRLTRYDGELKPGVARVRRLALVQAAYNLDAPRSDIVLQLLRTQRAGSTSASSVAAAYEFPLAQRRRPPMASLSFTRGITSGAHDNAVEADLSFRW